MVRALCHDRRPRAGSPRCIRTARARPRPESIATCRPVHAPHGLVRPKASAVHLGGLTDACARWIMIAAYDRGGPMTTFAPIAPTTHVPPTQVAKETFVVHQV